MLTDLPVSSRSWSWQLAQCDRLQQEELEQQLDELENLDELEQLEELEQLDELEHPLSNLQGTSNMQ